ncbi:Phosphoribulokinase/uridine kinase [Penicillium hispanicum]|uniref:Phosphoribulokinase/uridine kinase n=1 Tax=Penicillium hispanicum TaxID=1080232 RepID=UPI002541188C|nr:Phosphoribulokinase/uridine kinase [Penicillium hispanicum]KAJ5585556.1 Phosphoribulokinase/uridine kinase [Penicillium hispanicum]
MTKPQDEQSSTLIVGISGPSSSGKTTLARLLQRVFCGVDLTRGQDKLHTFIIHEDDFYRPDDQIPYTTLPSGKTVQDWDTAAAIDTTFLAQALAYVREHGTLPPRLQSKEDQNDASDSGVPDALVAEMRALVAAKLNGAAAGSAADGNPATPAQKTMAFMEGFLLYAAPAGSTPETSPLRPVQDQIHLPLFLPASYDAVKRRREGRSGYVTIGPAPEIPASAVAVERKEDGPIDLEQEDDRPPQNFWTDPPGYVDDIVWPRYVQDHAWLLVADETVDGDLIDRVGDGTNVRSDAGVKVVPGKGSLGMEEVLRWAVREILGFYLG